MAFLANYIISLVDAALLVYVWIVIVYCIAGFLVRDRHAGWYVFLQELVDPVLSRIRRWTRNKLVIENFDLSPIVLLVGIEVIRRILLYLRL
ncbi:MAG: YggT family protein [Acidobacteriota bacterium]|nr:YggT family protein [Acidobacteriota bacterium]